jgi:UDP-glucose 4-epimerase
MTEKKRAIVTGGAGFIGSHVVDRLLEREYEVLVIDNLANGFIENVHAPARLEEMDVVDAKVKNLFETFKPHQVYHLAAQANVRVSLDDPMFDTRVNAQGTLNMLENSRLNGVEKFIFTSTGGAIYGDPEKIPCPEETPCVPLSVYGANKLVAEHYVDVYHSSYGLEYAVARFANIYGPRQNPKGEAGVVAIFAELMLQDKQPVIFGDGSKTRDYVHVSDTVDAVMLIAEKGKNDIYNVGMGVRTSDQEVFDAVAAATGYEKEPEYADFRPGEVNHISLDATKLKNLGWKPEYDFRGGVEQTIPFYRKKLDLN